MEEYKLIVTKNYRPAIYLTLTMIIIAMMYFIYRSPITLKKEGIVIGSPKEGISELKILVHIRNRSSELIDDLMLSDLVPALSTLVKEKQIGSLSPSKILKHQKKGTLIRWKIEVLEPFEERIITYRVKTKMAIVGGLNLPSAKVKFKSNKGTDRILKSNKSQINLGM